MAPRKRLLDRALSALGLQRVSQAARTRAAYQGAVANRLTADWFAAMLSADQAIKGDLRKLRDRSRKLVRDFSYASRFVQAVAENVAGPNGTTLQVRVATADGTFKRTLNDEVEEQHARWAEDPTAGGRMALPDVEHLLCEATPQDGAYLARMLDGYRGNRYGFALEILDIDQLDHEFNEPRRETRTGVRNAIRMGVEVDEWNRPVAYWLWTNHPSEYDRRDRRRVRVPAEQVLHGYPMRRAGQTHGVPWFAPVLLDERMLQGFQEAAVVSARVGASQAPYLEAPDPAMVSGEPLAESFTMEVEPGVGQVLPPGYRLAQFTPEYPNNEFDPFRTAMLGSIAAGLRVSHLTLTGDLRQANYSSMRAGLLPERDAWRLVHGWFVRGFHRPVYRAWLRAAVLNGAVQVPPRELDRVLNGARWLPRGFPWVDPQKDMEARLRGVAAGVDTLTRICAENGTDYEEVIAERQREIQLAREAGVPIDLGVAGAAAPTDPTDGADATDSTDATQTGGAKAAAGGRALRLRSGL